MCAFVFPYQAKRLTRGNVSEILCRVGRKTLTSNQSRFTWKAPLGWCVRVVLCVCAWRCVMCCWCATSPRRRRRRSVVSCSLIHRNSFSSLTVSEARHLVISSLIELCRLLSRLNSLLIPHRLRKVFPAAFLQRFHNSLFICNNNSLIIRLWFGLDVRRYIRLVEWTLWRGNSSICLTLCLYKTLWIVFVNFGNWLTSV